MKIRAGYVSNSSSSSFCIVGIILSPGDIDEWFDVTEGYDYDDYYEFVYEHLKGLDSHHGIEEYGCDDVIIGKHITEMKDDQTLGDFKKGVFDILKKGGYKGELNDIKIFVDGGYEG